MGLSRYKLGELIELTDERNTDGRFTLDAVRGISTGKSFISTKANMDGVSLDSYKIVNFNEFAYVPDTSRRGDKIAIAYNNANLSILISSIYTTFKCKRSDLLIPEYLFMYFNRPEFDRYSRFNSWGSARETFSWEDFCDINITLPDIEVQRKYVDIYLSLQNNLDAYQSKTDDLKTVCNGYIENLRRDIGDVEIAPYIRNVDTRNSDLSVTLTQGVDVNMQFIPAKREAEDREGAKIVKTGQFAYNRVVKSNGTKLPIALRDGRDCVVSSSYEVFEVIDTNKLIPEYLMLWMSRTETQRLCGFKSYGTTRDIFSFDELCKLRFPIPNIETQRNIVNIYQCCIERQRIAEQLKEQLKNLCPILIKGSQTDI